MSDTHYLQAIIDYEINIEFCDKVVWLRPRTEGLSFLTEDVGIKLKDVGGDKNDVQANPVAHVTNMFTCVDSTNDKWVNINLDALVEIHSNKEVITFQ